MTETQVIQWTKDNLSADIIRAIADSGPVIYTEAWLAGMVCRETPGLIGKYGVPGKTAFDISPLMIGDGGHGHGFIQIDDRSYPDWINTGKWKVPYENFMMTIRVLEEKRKYLLAKFPVIAGDSLNHYVTAAFNCGQGNEAKVIESHLDPDAYSAGHNYAIQVFEFADIYQTL